MNEPTPNRDDYRAAYAIRVYDEPILELNRWVRLFFSRLSNPFYRLENFMSGITHGIATFLVGYGFRNTPEDGRQEN